MCTDLHQTQPSVYYKLLTVWAKLPTNCQQNKSILDIYGMDGNRYLAALGYSIAQWSSNLFLDEVQVLGQRQPVLLHHWLQVVGFNQVVKHVYRSLLMLQQKQTTLIQERNPSNNTVVIQKELMSLIWILFFIGSAEPWSYYGLGSLAKQLLSSHLLCLSLNTLLTLYVCETCICFCLHGSFGASCPTCQSDLGCALGINMRSNMWENGPWPGVEQLDQTGLVSRRHQLSSQLEANSFPFSYPGRGTALLSARRGCLCPRCQVLAASLSENKQVVLPGGTPC